MKTEQELFWQGTFGDEYTDRNVGENWIASNTAFFSRVLSRTYGIKSALELGANIGLNLLALKNLIPNVKLSAVEINEKAANKLKNNIPDIDLHLVSVLDFDPNLYPLVHKDIVLTKGVLIHINPAFLSIVYDTIYEASSHYILISEYYSPKPVEINYRGHENKLFKRDFAGEMLDKFPDLKLIDYGFVYHRDPNFPQDDMNWFLMEK